MHLCPFTYVRQIFVTHFRTHMYTRASYIIIKKIIIYVLSTQHLSSISLSHFIGYFQIYEKDPYGRLENFTNKDM